MEWLTYGVLGGSAAYGTYVLARGARARDSPARLGTRLGVFAVLFVLVVVPALSGLELFEQAIYARAAWRASHQACLDPASRASMSLHPGTRHVCSDAAQHSRWLVSVWLGLVRERGLVGLYLGANSGEILDGLAHDNWGVVGIKVALVALLPVALAGVWVVKVMRPEVYRKGDQVCWKDPNGDEVCACVHANEEKAPPPGPSE